jgi:hypothetical protein
MRGVRNCGGSQYTFWGDEWEKNCPCLDGRKFPSHLRKLPFRNRHEHSALKINPHHNIIQDCATVVSGIDSL